MALLDDDASHQHNGTLANTKASLDRIKQQLTTSGRFLLQGFLLKRSETLRKWNQRWFTLDPTTGKMEYRIERGDLVPKGSIIFDAASSIILSPINFQGLPKYDGCCIYIQTTVKKEYFLCAETRGAARAWVSTLQAAQLVLKAHTEAVSSLGGSGSAKLGTVAAVVAAANATAREAAKEIAVAMQVSGKQECTQGNDLPMDDLSIMKETLRIKDEELHQMAKETRARDATVTELAERLSETAEAAEAAASAAHIMDNERKAARTEIAKLRGEMEDKVRQSRLDLEAMTERLKAAQKARDEALKEAQMWRAELAKAREHAVMMEAALLRAEETARQAAVHAESGSKSQCTTEALGGVREEAEGTTSKSQAETVVACSDVGNTFYDPETVNPPAEVQLLPECSETDEHINDHTTKSLEIKVNQIHLHKSDTSEAIEVSPPVQNDSKGDDTWKSE